LASFFFLSFDDFFSRASASQTVVVHFAKRRKNNGGVSSFFFLTLRECLVDTLKEHTPAKQTIKQEQQIPSIAGTDQ
jgi:type VI protein secretion system component Hcp